MKRIIAIVAILAAAGLGYYQFSVVPAQKAAAEAAAAAEAEAKAAEEAAAAAAKAAEEAAAKAAEEAAAAAKAAEEAAAAAAAALDPAAFDAAKVTALIDGSTLDDATKTTLKAAVTAAASNPALVQGAVDQVKAALGM